MSLNKIFRISNFYKKMKNYVFIGVLIITSLYGSPLTAAPFDCSSDSEIYQVQSGQLRIFDTVSSSYVDVGVQNSPYNATGFNVLDNFGYGMQGQNVIRINSDGALDILYNVGFGSYAGDVDRNNTLWLRRSASHYDGVDLATGAVTTINFTGPTVNAADVAFVQDNGINYLIAPGISSVGFLNLDDGTSTTKPMTGLPGGGYGASWTDSNGRIFTFSNNTGEIFELFDVFDNTVASATAVLVAQGDPSGSNDGFACNAAAFPNLPPIAEDDDFVTDVNASVSGDVFVDNGNGVDIEPDGQSLTIETTPTTNPSFGTVVINIDGTFTYTPNTGFFGVDTFVYTISDPIGLTASATVTITIVAPTLTLVKEVINDGVGTSGIDAFGITTTGTTALNFDAGVVAGTTTTFTSDQIELIPGNYTLVESDVAGYSEGSWSCKGAAGTVISNFNNGSVDIATGENVVCIISNDDIPVADLEITKSVSNVNPEVGEIVEFTLIVTNNGPEDTSMIEVDDLVLDGFIFESSSMTGGDTQNQIAPNLQWTVNSLINGASVTLTYEAEVVSP